MKWALQCAAATALALATGCGDAPPNDARDGPAELSDDPQPGAQPAEGVAAGTSSPIDGRDATAASPAETSSTGKPSATGNPSATGDPAARSIFDEAPKAVKLGSIRSVAVSSVLKFAGAPDQPHELHFVFGFPARARLEVKGAGGVQARYRLGDHFWALDRPAGSGGPGPTSVELTGGERASLALDLAARRATFLWPHGGTFEGEGTTLTCPVPGAGVLVATLGGGSNELIEMRAFDAEGATAVRLVVDAWADGPGGRWPERVRLLDGHQTVWEETTTSYETGWFHGDPSFVPPDVLSAATGSTLAALRARVEPAHFRLEAPIRTGLGLGEAAAAAGAIWRDAGSSLGPRLVDHFDVVLNAAGEPTHVRLSAGPGAARPPELSGHAWTLVEEQFYWRLELGPAGPQDAGVPAAALGSIQERATVGPVVLRTRTQPGATSPGSTSRTLMTRARTGGHGVPDESHREDGPPR